MEIDFAEFVTDLDRGRVNQQLGEQLMRVIDAVQETGKSGKLTVTFTVAKESNMAQVVGPSFAFVMHRRGDIERDAFGEVRTEIADATGLPVFAGTPET